jgi:hypothetical protein
LEQELEELTLHREIANFNSFKKITENIIEEDEEDELKRSFRKNENKLENIKLPPLSLLPSPQPQPQQRILLLFS